MSEYLKDLEEYKKPKIVPIIVKKEKNQKFTPKPDPILLKLYPDPHPLSSEQQSLFVKLTEGAFGYNEQIRNEALNLLSIEYNIKFLAPYICSFIKEAIQVNITFPDLSLLIYSVRMVKSLMNNPHVELKTELHLIIPSVISCVISRKISKYNYDNHWTLRDFSAQVIAAICHNYGNNVNNIKKRVIKIYLQSIHNQRRPLTTVYGGIKGLGCLGEEVIQTYLMPCIPALSWRVGDILEQSIYYDENNIELKQIKYVSNVIVATVAPVLYKHRRNEDAAAYIRDFGYMGYALYSQVENMEINEMNKKSNHNVYLYRPE